MKTLIEAVRKIDQDAADYLEKEVAPRYDVTPGKIERIKKGIAETIKAAEKAAKEDGHEYTATPEADLLSAVFYWDTSPQKQPFWMQIWEKLKDQDDTADSKR